MAGALLSLDLARSRLLGRPARAPLLSLKTSSLDSSLLSGTVAREHAGVAVRRGVSSFPSRLAPRDLILITILLFLSSELQLRQLRKREPPTHRFTFHPLIFHFVSFSLSLPSSNGKRSFPRSMRSPTARTKDARILIAIFNAPPVKRVFATRKRNRVGVSERVVVVLTFFVSLEWTLN